MLSLEETAVEEVEEMCKMVEGLKADGILVSPGYEYESVEQDVFLTKEQIHEKFQAIRKFSILPVDWTEEGGQMTPSLKLKRAVVMKEFAGEVEALYSGGPQ